MFYKIIVDSNEFIHTNQTLTLQQYWDHFDDKFVGKALFSIFVPRKKSNKKKSPFERTLNLILTRRTNWAASIIPKPNAWLTRFPTPLVFQSNALRYFGLAVSTIKCWTSRHVKLRFASSANAIIPAAMGADADVPWNIKTHLFKENRFFLQSNFTSMIFCTLTTEIGGNHLFFIGRTTTVGRR